MTIRRLIHAARPAPGPLAAALVAVVVAVVLIALAHPPAGATNDALANVAPASQLPGGSLANTYPLGNYALDHHFSAVDAGVFSGVDVSGIAPTIAWFLAQMIWMLTAFAANAVIVLFTFAFSLDLVNGSSVTGGQGALAPVADAVRTVHRDVFGQPWLVVAVLLTGMWAMWNALVRRRYAQTAGALGLSLAFVVLALAFVTRPEIVGQASRWTNQMSTAFLSLSTSGQLTNPQRAKQANADHLFDVLVFQPWVVLNFGGLEHCVTGAGDEQRSVPVRPLASSPAREAALSRRLASASQIQADGKTCVNHANKYAPRFLRFAPETAERKAQYEALKAGDVGKLPDADPAKSDGSYRLGEVDKPAAEAMGKGGQYQRLLLATVILAGQLGAYVLLGALSVAVILAQVLVLLLLAFAPVALVVGVFPGRGHDCFKAWLARLATFLLRKAIYSLLLAVLLAVAAALADATASLGWLMAFGLQAVFYWTVLLNRHRLIGPLNHATTGDRSAPDSRLAAITYATAKLAGRRPRRPAPSDPTDAPAAAPELPDPPPGAREDHDGDPGRDRGQPPRDDDDTNRREQPRTGSAAPGERASVLETGASRRSRASERSDPATASETLPPARPSTPRGHEPETDRTRPARGEAHPAHAHESENRRPPQQTTPDATTAAPSVPDPHRPLPASTPPAYPGRPADVKPDENRVAAPDPKPGGDHAAAVVMPPISQPVARADAGEVGDDPRDVSTSEGERTATSPLRAGLDADAVRLRQRAAATAQPTRVEEPASEDDQPVPDRRPDRERDR